MRKSAALQLQRLSNILFLAITRQPLGQAGTPLFSFWSILTLIMPPKIKNKKLTTLPTMKKAKSAGRSKKQPSYVPPADTEVLSMEGEEEPSLKSMIAMLGSMNNIMGHLEQRLYSLTTDAASSQTFSTGLTGPSTTRSSAVTRETAPNNFPEVAEEVWARVASWLRGSASLFNQTDEDTVSEEDQKHFFNQNVFSTKIFIHHFFCQWSFSRQSLWCSGNMQDSQLGGPGLLPVHGPHCVIEAG